MSYTENEQELINQLLTTISKNTNTPLTKVKDLFKSPPKEKKGFSPEERERRRQLILKTQPWKKLKGTKTPEGKKRSSMNAWKHGRNSQAMKEIKKMLKVLKDNDKAQTKQPPKGLFL